MDKNYENIAIPVTSERVWRTYQGGKLIDVLHGMNGDNQKDSYFPEEWITSLVVARNVGREHIVGEGLSMLKSGEGSLKELIMSEPKRYLGKEHVEKHGDNMGVLIKLIDSSERLTIQVHPDRNMAKDLFNSAFGKTESWYIIGGRNIDGKPPCVYLGFKEGITREKWIKLFEEQDIDTMLDCLHCFPINPQDTILIEGGVPHAIGAGCFIAEIQEPTDYTLRVEKTTPTGFKVDDFMCHQGLGFEKMFDCFHYMGYSKEETASRWFLNPTELEKQPGGVVTSLINYDDTNFFKINLIKISDTFSLYLESVFSSMYILEGEGTMVMYGHRIPLMQGDQYFIPATVRQIHFESNCIGQLQVLHCFGPK
jgi:mannose-6-phosphate isomerase